MSNQEEFPDQATIAAMIPLPQEWKDKIGFREVGAKAAMLIPGIGLVDAEGLEVPSVDYYMPHTGFYLPNGAHVLGNPLMDNSTVNAINEMVKLAKKMK